MDVADRNPRVIDRGVVAAALHKIDHVGEPLSLAAAYRGSQIGIEVTGANLADKQGGNAITTVSSITPGIGGVPGPGRVDSARDAGIRPEFVPDVDKG